MLTANATIRLRPLRIGFLVRPNDLPSVREIMRYCAGVWGGIYNPIIPVFSKPPKAWPSEPYDRVRGLGVAKGYVRFFEPDVYVESEKGLLELVGLAAVRERLAIYPDVLALDELLKPEAHKDWCEPPFGLNIQDVQVHLYRTDQQFTKRDRRENIIVSPVRGSGVTELIFGAYPTQSSVRYLAKGYQECFQPTKLRATPESWKKIFVEHAGSPLSITRYGLDAQRYWYHDAVIFVFDPRQPTDLIDAWNLRLEPHPVIPVPVDWFPALGDFIFSVLKTEYRRIQGNPQGLMHNATIEFSRSITQSDAETLVKSLKPGLPSGALMVKFWRNRIWVEMKDHRVHGDHRLIVTAAERGEKLQINEDQRASTFETLSPDFARRYGGRHHRWVNAVTVSAHSDHVATVLPFNSTNPSWPRLGLGDPVLVGGEGWIFSEQFKGSSQWLQFLSHQEAISGFLERLGFKARLSEPGHIARQMLDQLGGLWGVHLLADMDTLTLLNKMAGGLRKRSTETEEVEESFGLRAAPLKDWVDHIAKRKEMKRLPAVSLDDFTTKNVVRLGLETDCPHCQAKNWNSLAAVDYEITCERCLKPYPFPQAAVREHNRNWNYRVVGPFSVPDYGRGSYAALLTLRLLERFRSASDQMTFSTAMLLDFDGRQAEVDFVALRSAESHDLVPEPELIVGEAKSGGRGQLIKAKDLSQLKAVATKLPGAIVVIAILRDHFLSSEKRILEPFVKWGRRLNEDRRPTNPVVLLTSNELMFDHFLSATWEGMGGEHAKFTSYDHTQDLHSLADSTQQIYLGLPSFDAVRRSQWEKRMQGRQPAAPKEAESDCLKKT
jgi:hypothetical protein